MARYFWTEHKHYLGTITPYGPFVIMSWESRILIVSPVAVVLMRGAQDEFNVTLAETRRRTDGCTALVSRTRLLSPVSCLLPPASCLLPPASYSLTNPLNHFRLGYDLPSCSPQTLNEPRRG